MGLKLLRGGGLEVGKRGRGSNLAVLAVLLLFQCLQLLLQLFTELSVTGHTQNEVQLRKM